MQLHLQSVQVNRRARQKNHVVGTSGTDHVVGTSGTVWVRQEEVAQASASQLLSSKAARGQHDLCTKDLNSNEHTRTRMQTRARTCTHACTHAHTLTYTHIHTYTHTHIWHRLALSFHCDTYSRTHTCIHAYKHTHTHTHTHTLWARIPEIQVRILSRAMGTFFPHTVSSIFRLSLTHTHVNSLFCPAHGCTNSRFIIAELQIPRTREHVFLGSV